MNRTSTGLSAASAAIPSISSPFISTQGTQLIFTLSCCSSAASIARSTLSTPAARSARSQPVMQRKRSGSSVSRLMFTAVSPALRYTSACGGSQGDLPESRQSMDLLHQPRQIFPYHGFPTGQTHFSDSQLFHDPHQPEDFFQRQYLLMGSRRDPLRRHAVSAPEITLVRHRYPQIINFSSQTVLHYVLLLFFQPYDLFRRHFQIQCFCMFQCLPFLLRQFIGQHL